MLQPIIDLAVPANDHQIAVIGIMTKAVKVVSANVEGMEMLSTVLENLPMRVASSVDGVDTYVGIDPQELLPTIVVTEDHNSGRRKSIEFIPTIIANDDNTHIIDVDEVINVITHNDKYVLLTSDSTKAVGWLDTHNGKLYCKLFIDSTSAQQVILTLV